MSEQIVTPDVTPVAALIFKSEYRAANVLVINRDVFVAVLYKNHA